MEFKRCSKGHYYDPGVTDFCPQCAAEASASAAGETVPVEMNDNATQPLYGADSFIMEGDIGKTVPIIKEDETRDMSDGSKPEGYNGVTKPVGMDGDDLFFMPVTGWLVCVDGPAKGTDYRVRAGYNYIGRASNMDICIAGDDKIGRERHALIAYDSQEKVFFFGPSDGKSIVRLNGKMVMVPTEIYDHDIITIGATKLMFVPLCGERFNWDA